jgi:DNA-directed RNA polymerase specialized sigma subunit
MADMTSRGRQARGSINGSAKLTEQDVLEIRAIRGMTQQAIADQYGVSQKAISEIINRKIWRHI